MDIGPGDIKMNGLYFWKAYFIWFMGKLCEINKVLGPVGPFCIWGNWGSEKVLKVCSTEEWKIENRSSEFRLDLFGVPWCHSGGERLLLQIGSLEVLAKLLICLWKSGKFCPCIFHPSKERTSGFLFKYILTSDNTKPVFHQGNSAPSRLGIAHIICQVAHLSYQLWAKKDSSYAPSAQSWGQGCGCIALGVCSCTCFKIIFSFFHCLDFQL